MKKLQGYARLTRPANIVTSVADILAGIAISGFLITRNIDMSVITPLLLLCASTIGLYGGGVVFNDVFDSGLDNEERPERPIPSGLISVREASVLGSALLIFGIACAFLVNTTAGVLAVSIAIAAMIYNKWGKHHTYLGPPNMGLCRGLNLLLGISVVPASVLNIWIIALVPVLYISAVTMISRGEVHGSSQKPLYGALVLYGLVVLLIFGFSVVTGNLLFAMLFLAVFAWMIFRPLLSALKSPSASNIGNAVKAGVISLIVMDAAWASASGMLALAFVIVLLLPLSFWLARLFAVT